MKDEKQRIDYLIWFSVSTKIKTPTWLASRMLVATRVSNSVEIAAYTLILNSIDNSIGRLNEL